MSGNDMDLVDQERLDVAENALQRLLSGYKAKGHRKGKALRRLQQMEHALSHLHAIRLVK